MINSPAPISSRIPRSKVIGAGAREERRPQGQTTPPNENRCPRKRAAVIYLGVRRDRHDGQAAPTWLRCGAVR